MSTIHIGQLVKEQVKRKRMRVAQLSEILNVSEPNVYKIYLRSSIDTVLLEKICIALDYNFFAIYSQRFSLDTKDSRLSQYEKENELLRFLVKEKDEKYQLLLSSKTKN
jgi:DNA-binding Xre family transcriptional regulator